MSCDVISTNGMHALQDEVYIKDSDWMSKDSAMVHIHVEGF